MFGFEQQNLYSYVSKIRVTKNLYIYVPFSRKHFYILYYLRPVSYDFWFLYRFQFITANLHLHALGMHILRTICDNATGKNYIGWFINNSLEPVSITLEKN